MTNNMNTKDSKLSTASHGVWWGQKRDYHFPIVPLPPIVDFNNINWLDIVACLYKNRIEFGGIFELMLWFNDFVRFGPLNRWHMDKIEKDKKMPFRIPSRVMSREIEM